MEYKYYTISNKVLLAIYLLKLASENNATCIVISHSALKEHFKLDKIYESRIKEFYKGMKNYFDGFTSSSDTTGTSMTITIKKEDILKGWTIEKRLPVIMALSKVLTIDKIPSDEEMLKEIGGSVLTIGFNINSFHT